MQGFRILCIATCAFLVLDVLEARPNVNTGEQRNENVKPTNSTTGKMTTVFGQAKDKLKAQVQNTVKKGKEIGGIISRKNPQTNSAAQTHLPGIKNNNGPRPEINEPRNGNRNPINSYTGNMLTNFAQAKNAATTYLQNNTKVMGPRQDGSPNIMDQRNGNKNPIESNPAKMTPVIAHAKDVLKNKLDNRAYKLGVGLERAGGKLIQRGRKNAPNASGK